MFDIVDSGEGENVDIPSRWEQELNLLQEHFSPVHVVGTIPPYCDREITEPVEVLVFVRNKGGKTSEGFPFRYTPGKICFLFTIQSETARPVCLALCSGTRRGSSAIAFAFNDQKPSVCLYGIFSSAGACRATVLRGTDERRNGRGFSSSRRCRQSGDREIGNRR